MDVAVRIQVEKHNCCEWYRTSYRYKGIIVLDYTIMGAGGVVYKAIGSESSIKPEVTVEQLNQESASMVGRRANNHNVKRNF